MGMEGGGTTALSVSNLGTAIKNQGGQRHKKGLISRECVDGWCALARREA